MIVGRRERARVRGRIVSGVGSLAKLLLGSGKLEPELRAELEAEGLVMIEEGLAGSVRYKHFKAPGRRQHGKVRGERIGLAISRERVVAYCHSGRTELIDAPFSDPRIGMLDVSLEGDDRVVIRVDYDLGEVPKVSGEVAIHATTPNAARFVDELRARIGR